MFTGIIEQIGNIKSIRQEGTNKVFCLSVSFLHELKIDQSIAHNGVCLTVSNLYHDIYEVTAIAETLQCTNLDNWQVHDKINVERCMPANGRFDGHIVQGHVDTTAVCTQIEDLNGSWKCAFQYQDSENITVQKGSICINGISLTVVDSETNSFSVAIIPYTFEHTNFKTLKVGDKVNLEFDIIGKYLQKMMRKG